MAYSRKDLVKAARELNRKLLLEPPIDTAAPDHELEAMLVEASSLIVPEDDVSAETMALLSVLTSKTPGDEAEESAVPGSGTSPAEQQVQVEGETENEEEPATKAKKEKKPSAKKPVAKPGKSTKVVVESGRPAETRGRRLGLTRTGAVVLVLKQVDEIDYDELVAKADELYVHEMKAKSNISESRAAVRHALNTLEPLGYVEMRGTTIVNKLPK